VASNPQLGKQLLTSAKTFEWGLPHPFEARSDMSAAYTPPSAQVQKRFTLLAGLEAFSISTLARLPDLS
jgi:hypothetical protein